MKTLSDKQLEYEDSYPSPHYLEEDVKQFIKDLKEMIEANVCNIGLPDEEEVILKYINKLAGDKLC